MQQPQQTQDTPFDTFRKSLSSKAKVYDREHKKYDKLKNVFNGIHNNKRPLFLAHPGTTSDVVKIINYARENNITVVARGGSHSFAGNSTIEDGIVIDFKRMKAIHVNQKNKTAEVEMGLLGADLDNELAHFNLYAVAGTVSNTGVSGLVLHGGFGIMTNASGVAVKNIVELEVVTASGEVLICNEQENKDLFWGCKGSPSSFVIVTRMKLQCHSFRTNNATIYSALRVYPPTEFVGLSKHIEKCFPSLSENAFVIAGITVMNGNKVVMLDAKFNGYEEEAKKEFQELLSYGTPIMAQEGMMPYVVSQASIDHIFPYNHLYYEKGALCNFNEGALELTQQFALDIDPESNIAMMHFYVGHHAFDNTGGCFSLHNHKKARFFVSGVCTPQGDQNFDKYGQQLRGLWKSLDEKKLIDYLQIIYVNFLMEEDLKKLDTESIYGKPFSALSDLKKKYDPNNFFKKAINNVNLSK